MAKTPLEIASLARMHTKELSELPNCQFASPRHWNTIAQVRPDLMWRGWVMER